MTPPKDGWTVTAVSLSPIGGIRTSALCTVDLKAVSGAWHLSLLCEADGPFTQIPLDMWAERDEWHLDDLLAWFRLAGVPFTYDVRRDIFWEVME